MSRNDNGVVIFAGSVDIFKEALNCWTVIGCLLKVSSIASLLSRQLCENPLQAKQEQWKFSSGFVFDWSVIVMTTKHTNVQSGHYVLWFVCSVCFCWITSTNVIMQRETRANHLKMSRFHLVKSELVCAAEDTSGRRRPIVCLRSVGTYVWVCCFVRWWKS